MNDKSPILYYVDKEYLKYLHKEDYKVSVKFNNRPFVRIVTFVNNKKYVIPLTSQNLTGWHVLQKKACVL